MSHECSAWAWQQVERCETTSCLVVLLKLADMAHADGKAWPSHAYLAKRTGLSERTVRAAIASLETSDLIRTTPRAGRSDVIYLRLSTIVIEPQVVDEMEQGVRGRPQKTPANFAKPRQNLPDTPARFAYDTVKETVNRTSSSPSERDAPFDKTEWGERFEQAKEAAGDAADLTRPAMLHCRDLRALVEPLTGEPCEWGEVLDAIRMVAARQRTRGKQITTWAWVREDALALRDKRLAGNPEPSPVAYATKPSGFANEILTQQANARRRVLEMTEKANGDAS